jgi:hypothetical protein
MPSVLYYQSVAGILNFLGQLGAVVPSVGVLGGVLYWLLQKRMEATLAQRLEVTKHQLQLDYQRMSIVFEHQRDSFRRVLAAMHETIETMEAGDSEQWYPISREVVDKFRRVVSEECLLLDEESDHALRLFVDATSQAVSPPFEADPSQEDMWRAHSLTAFIFERLADHFRFRVGLVPQELDRVLDVQLLGASMLINRYHFPDHNLPTRGPLAFREGETAAELVAAAKTNLPVLLSELNSLQAAIAAKEGRSRAFFQVGLDVSRYLMRFAEAGPRARRSADRLLT